MIRLIICLLFLTCFAGTGLAREVGFGIAPFAAEPTVHNVSRIGKVTGNACRSDSDCIVGCTAGQPDDLKCLTPSEASNECVAPDEAPHADYPCGCLEDVKRCGFVFAKPKAVEEEQTITLTQPAKPVIKAAPKKAHHKKPVHKKKPTKPNAPATCPAPAPCATTPAPTPHTEPAHDSGQ